VATKQIDDDVTPSLLQQLFSYLFSASKLKMKKKVNPKGKKQKIANIDA